VVVAREHPPAVLPRQRRDDVDVVVGVPHRHPPHRLLIPTPRQAELVQVLGGDVRPLPVGQRPVPQRPVCGSFAAAIARW
jgi:hypothetical protein